MLTCTLYSVFEKDNKIYVSLVPEVYPGIVYYKGEKYEFLYASMSKNNATTMAKIIAKKKDMTLCID